MTNAGVSIAGQYGTLVLHADGSYTYTRAAGTPGKVDDVFHYTLTDGDGDQSSTTLTIHIGDAGVTVTAPAIGTAADTVYEAGLANGSQQGNTQTIASGTITVAAPDGVGSITVDGKAVALDGSHTTITDGARGSLDVWWNTTTKAIDYTYTLQHNYLESPAANNGQDLEAQPQFAVVVTDQDGSVGNGNLTINIVDDQPFLGPIDNGIVSDQAGLVVHGSLHLIAGADGISSITLSGTPPANLTLDGTHHILYQVVGNTLTAYADLDNSGTVNSGDTKVFTLTADASTGTYEFNLLQSLTVMNGVNASTAHGSGPSQEQELFSGATAVALLSSTSGGVNGSTNGWGVGNNNFDPNENMRFDFTGTHSPAPVAGFNPAAPEYAYFSFSNYKSGSQIAYIIHFTDGSSLNSSFDPSKYPDSAHQLQLGQTGKLIDYVDFNDVTGSGKVDLAGVASVSTVSQDLSFNVTATDGDGDKASSSLTVHIEGGSTLTGTSHDDILIAGTGNNTMTGGAGADTFVINAATWTSHGSIHDLITDYHSNEGDVVDLSKVLDAVFGGTQTSADALGSLSATKDATGIHIDVTHGGSTVEVATLAAYSGISNTINIVFDDAHHPATLTVA